MKKHLLIISLILAVTAQTVFAAEVFNSPADLENFHERFYEAPTNTVPDMQVVEGSTMGDVRGMPLFKKTRIRVTNFLRERDYKKTQQLLEQERQRYAQEIEEYEKELDVSFVDPVEESIEKMELEGGVREQVTSNNVMLDADNIDYNEETMDIVATGSPKLTFPQQKISIKATKMVYNQASNILKIYDNVEIYRDDNVIKGDYIQLNMNEENAVLDNLDMKQSFMSIKARKSEMQGDTIVLYNGKILSEDSYILNLRTKMIGGNRFDNMVIDEDDKSFMADELGDTAVHVKAKEIEVTAKKNNDVITLKKARIRYGDHDLINFKKLSIHTNKRHEYFEGNYPELGSRGRLGMFAGPGFVVDTPLQNGSSVKLIPIINKKDDFGFGGLLKYHSATNRTEMGYGSGADVFILKGKQHLDDKLYMQYGSNSFMNEWFLGPRMSKYNAELIYHDRGVIPNSIGKDLDLQFKHRFGIGYMQNSDYNRHGESIPISNMGTMRTRYMAEAAQTFFKYENKAERKIAELALVLQGSAAVYGTGDTQFIGRIGPRLHSQYKYWLQDIGFFASGYHDGTPMQVYDSYRYGHANVYLREAIRVHKYLTLAWSGSFTMGDDAPNGKMCQENSFIFAFGPDDLKFNIGYDWVRRQTYFSVVVAMDTIGSSVEFDKMVIKNPDRLSRDGQKDVELKVFDIENQVTQPKKMKYAEVIDIEDPNREEL